MSDFKIIRSGEAEATYEIKNRNSKIEKKFQDDHLQVSIFHLSPERILYIEPLASVDSYKTYFVLEGSCFALEDNSIIKKGDMFIYKSTSTIQTLKTLEDTILLVHASDYDVYSTIEEKQEKIDRLLHEIQDKDHYTGEHSKRVFELVKKLALKLGYKDQKLNDIIKAAYYHDLGKIFIDDAILNKPDKLNPYEYDEIKKHTELSKAMILEHFNENVHRIIVQHHERLDGSGYPLGLYGEEILHEARILAVCDSYDAMITNRIYKNGKSPELALLELKELSGIKYDSEIVSAFIRMVLD